MLAKVWKKALLAVCIIACLFNVMHKLISRTSLEVQLKSVENQASLLDIFQPNDTSESKINSQQEEKTSENKQVDTNEIKQPISDDDDTDDTIVVIN